MTINTFTRAHLNSFYKKTLNAAQTHIQNLAADVRNNGEETLTTLPNCRATSGTNHLRWQILLLQ
jgi:hypothetical protein